MKLTQSSRRTKAMTLTEVLVVVFIIAVLAAMVLPPANRQSKSKAQLINCTSNLKQIGIACRIWESDGDKYPMREPVKRGGAMELVATGNVAAVFQVMSNELSTPKVLICPSDADHHAATNFLIAFGNQNISYFVGLGAADQYPTAILAGDDNLQTTGVPVKSGVMELSTNTPIAWTGERHHFKGNILLTDGSVSTTTDSGLANTIIKQCEDSFGFTNRFRWAIP